MSYLLLRKRRAEVLEKVKIFHAGASPSNDNARMSNHEGTAFCSALAWQAKVLKVLESRELRQDFTVIPLPQL